MIGVVRTYYHGTLASNLASIMEHGLDPSRCKDIDEPRPYVFMGYNLDTALAFAPGGELCLVDEPGVILAITLPRYVHRRLTFNRGEFIRSKFVIGPQYITVERYTNQSNQDKAMAA